MKRELSPAFRRYLMTEGELTGHRVEPELNSQGEVEKWKHRGFYWFVHTPEIRDSYDTYHVIESLAKSGFADRTPDTNVTIFASAGKR